MAFMLQSIISICSVQKSNFIETANLQMRLFIIYNDSTGSRKTVRITANVPTTSQLLKLIANKIEYPKNAIIVSLKHQLCDLRIIDGWNISHYPIRNGSKIHVAYNQELGKTDLTQVSSLERIQESSQLDIQDEQIDYEKQNQELSFISESGQYDWNKYFDESLQMFLVAVRSGSLQKVAQVIKMYPQSDKARELNLQQVYQNKVNYQLNQLGQCGRNSLHWAIHIKNIQIMNFVLIKCCSILTQTLDGYSPLQLAIQIKFEQGINTLLEHPKIDINQQTVKGSALHSAVTVADLKTIKRLLSMGIQTEITNQQGKTAFQLCNDQQILKVLQTKSQRNRKSQQTQYILKGILFKVSSITYSLKKRELIVNPFTAELRVVEGKQVEIKVPVFSINQIQLIKLKQYGWLMNKKMYYFSLCYQQDKKIMFAAKHKQIAERWVYMIKRIAKCWSQGRQSQKGKLKNYLSKVPAQQQLVQHIDDQKNEIKHHKRKVPNLKTKNDVMRFSIMDLKVVDQEQPIDQKLNKLNEKQLDFQKVAIEEFDGSNFNEQDTGDKFRDSEIMIGSILGQQSIVTSIVSSGKGRMTFNNADLSNQSARSSTTVISLGNHNPETNVQMFQIKQQQTPQQEQILDTRPCFRHFSIIRLLGNGSFGKVFLAKHQRTKKIYALKVLNKKKLQIKKQMKYAISQVNILKRVNSQFIIKLHYSFQTPNNLYMAIDYCPNSDLSQLLNQKQTLTQKSAKFVLAQILEALQHLHSLGIIYRDLKPQNILITSDGYVCLADFGLSRQKNFSKSFCGSPAYLSPQMLQKKGVGLENDIYGLGCVFYQMLTGEPPYFDQDIDQLFQNIRSGKLRYPPHISKQAKSLISGLLERKILNRLGVKDKEEIRNHEFFRGFQWGKLRRKQIQPPREMIPPKSQLIQLQKVQNHGFTDQDYEIRHSYVNRVKNFTFFREEDLKEIRQSFYQH